MRDTGPRPEKGGDEGWAGPRQPRLKWHHIYYLLAAFDLATVCFTLFLTHQILGIYNESVEVNRAWAERIGRFAALARVTTEVNAPGNDVFQSRDVELERARLDEALLRFEWALAAAKANLRFVPDDDTATTLAANLDRVGRATLEMAAESRRIFSHFDEDNPELAGHRMAEMDRKFAEVRSALEEIDDDVREMQQRNLDSQTEAAAVRGRYEYLVGLFIVLMVVAITLYGHMLARKMQADQLEREAFLSRLQEAESRTRSILSSAVEGIITSDERGVIESVNPAAEQMLGYDADELRGQNVSVLAPPPHRESHDGYMRRYLRTGVSKVIGRGGREVLALRKDGTTLPVQLAISEVRRPEGRLFTAMMHDISERKRAEALVRRYNEELEATVRERTEVLREALEKQSVLARQNAEAYEVIRRTQQELVRSERLAAVGELAAAVAHGIRNPLASIRAAAQVGRSFAKDELLKRTVEDIVAEVDRVERRIRAVLDFARPFEPRLASNDLNTFVSDLAKTVEKHAIEGSQITVELDPELPPLSFDGGQLYEVLEAIAVNALEAMSGEGRLTLRTALERRDGAPREAVVYVSDTGPGIEASRKDLIFDLFYTSKPSGTGIGLAMAKRLIESQGGTIEVESEPGRGTTFAVRLPVAERSGAA